MANHRSGFNYYSVDTDRYLDLRIKRLKKNCGPTGIAVYDYVLNEIYRVKGCYAEWNEDLLFDIAEYFTISETQVKEIIDECCDVGLFNKKQFDNGFVTSKSIQDRFVKWSKIAKRVEESYRVPDSINLLQTSGIIQEDSVKLQEESTKHQEDSPELQESFRKFATKKESRVKKSKLKESKLLMSDVDESTLDMTSQSYFRIAKSFWSLIRTNLVALNLGTTTIDGANYDTWVDPIKFLVEKDKRTLDEIREVYSFIRDDDFWIKQIRSTEKLRKKKDGESYFEKLLFQSRSKYLKSNSKVTGAENHSSTKSVFKGAK